MLELGQKVKFIHSDKYDNKEHTILNVKNIDDELSYFLHYWSWVDEDDLQLVEYRNGERV